MRGDGSLKHIALEFDPSWSDNFNIGQSLQAVWRENNTTRGYLYWLLDYFLDPDLDDYPFPQIWLIDRGSRALEESHDDPQWNPVVFRDCGSTYRERNLSRPWSHFADYTRTAEHFIHLMDDLTQASFAYSPAYAFHVNQYLRVLTCDN